MALVPLQDAVVWRGGITARQWTLETREVKCGKNGKNIELYCQVSSKGGGTTAVSIRIGSQDFSTLARAMCDSDRHAAMMTLATELSREVAQQPQRDTVLVQETYRSITELAQWKVLQAPDEDDHVESIICNGVKKLIKELSPKEKAKSKAA